MESFQHVENLPSQRMACDECVNLSLETLLKRYSIRASLKSSRSHPYLRPIENVCSETNNDFDKKRHFLSMSDNNFKKDDDLMCIGKPANECSPQQHNSSIQSQSQDNSYFSNQSLIAGFKTQYFPNNLIGNSRLCANKSYSDCKNQSSYQSNRAFQSDKMLVSEFNTSSVTKTVVDTRNNNKEMCQNSMCDVCQDFNKVQCQLETLLASGTESAEALNLLQKHYCSHGKEDFEFECELCGCSFDCCEELISHLSLHPENWPYVCQMCKKRFKSSLEESKHACREKDTIVKS